MIRAELGRAVVKLGLVCISGCTHLFGPPAEIAAAIRRVRTELGLPISIGVARGDRWAQMGSVL